MAKPRSQQPNFIKHNFSACDWTVNGKVFLTSEYIIATGHPAILYNLFRVFLSGSQTALNSITISHVSFAVAISLTTFIFLVSCPRNINKTSPCTAINPH